MFAKNKSAIKINFLSITRFKLNLMLDGISSGGDRYQKTFGNCMGLLGG